MPRHGHSTPPVVSAQGDATAHLHYTYAHTYLYRHPALSAKKYPGAAIYCVNIPSHITERRSRLEHFHPCGFLARVPTQPDPIPHAAADVGWWGSPANGSLALLPNWAIPLPRSI
ncbi:hypothetical protein GGTG_13718 [Gaeumannomyces tritici R3-111a-1]|uniref:Uncharacterized protein n=1 Tax=Gaeumannomyces tritici (strain R3-111a-1) TaxID=644352 RepID=J3PJN1_GAET3|nr:hypothetical protein GGTG_13718 [Gaeumannomyces tritici R3-111a-1]EJT68716.1 hypothetical protein GGTG_13718 [Gaeumannomyces tritici R3-111a-1]